MFTASAAYGIQSSDITDWNGKQAQLVSGTNIKTINNESLLGNGNISISSGGGTWGSITGTLSDQTDLNNALGNKQSTIDSSHKLSADLVDDTSTTNKFVTASDKTTWSGKQDALVSGTNIKTINNYSVLGNGNLDIFEWKLVDTKTGKTAIDLPASFNELSIMIYEQVYFSLHLNAKMLDTTARRFNTGYFQSSGLGGRAQISISKTSCAIYSVVVNSNETSDNAQITVYYR